MNTQPHGIRPWPKLSSGYICTSGSGKCNNYPGYMLSTHIQCSSFKQRVVIYRLHRLRCVSFMYIPVVGENKRENQ